MEGPRWRETEEPGRGRKKLRQRKLDRKTGSGKDLLGTREDGQVRSAERG